MIYNIVNTKYEEGLLIVRLQTPTRGSVIVKARRSGSFWYINPPPEDDRCEVCGRKVDNLEPFDEQFSKALMAEEKTSNGFLQMEGPCFTKSITTNHRLVKHFRSFQNNVVETSWECKVCYSLSSKEAVEANNDLDRS